MPPGRPTWRLEVKCSYQWVHRTSYVKQVQWLKHTRIHQTPRMTLKRHRRMRKRGKGWPFESSHQNLWLSLLIVIAFSRPLTYDKLPGCLESLCSLPYWSTGQTRLKHVLVTVSQWRELPATLIVSSCLLTNEWRKCSYFLLVDFSQFRILIQSCWCKVYSYSW